MEANDVLKEIDSIPPDSSVMMALKEKETELKTETLKIRRLAEEMVAKARAEAAEIREQARRQGEKKSQDMLKKGLLEAQDQAKEIAAGGERQVKVINEKAQANYLSAVQLVVKAIAGRSKEITNVKG